MNPAHDLYQAAKDAMSKAHAPYSRFHVGAALRGRDGRVFSGANVENAAYPQGWCAETTAIAAMIMAGESAIAEFAVCASGTELITPCGGCRQKIREFAGGDTPIHLCSTRGIEKTVTLGDLLPMSFGPVHLTGHPAKSENS